jgi:hypothetical protein
MPAQANLNKTSMEANPYRDRAPVGNLTDPNENCSDTHHLSRENNQVPI